MTRSCCCILLYLKSCWPRDGVQVQSGLIITHNRLVAVRADRDGPCRHLMCMNNINKSARMNEHRLKEILRFEGPAILTITTSLKCSEPIIFSDDAKPLPFSASCCNTRSLNPPFYSVIFGRY